MPNRGFAYSLIERPRVEPSPDAVGLTIFYLASGVCALGYFVARWVL